MPWTNVECAPLGVAALKAFLAQRGVEADCYYLNLRLAERLGRPALTMGRMGYPWPEWFFAYHLFGPGGTGEWEQDFEALYEEDAGFREFLTEIRLPRDAAETLLMEAIPEFLEDCLRSVPWARYDVLGFSSLSNSHMACLGLAKRLKDLYTDKFILFGGANVEGSMGAATLKGCGWVDGVVSGEGEKALVALLENAARGRPRAPVRGVLFQGDAADDALPGEPADIAVLPPPDHDDFYDQLKRLPGLASWLQPVPYFEASRGCWWGQKSHCVFCGINGLDIAYREKSAERALRDFLHVHERYQALRVNAADDIMSLGHMTELSRRLAEARLARGGDWEINFQLKSNLKAEQMRALAAAGITRALAGIESLSTPILRLMRKGVRAIQNVQTLKWSMREGVEIEWFFLYGFPGEPIEEYRRMTGFIPAIMHLTPPVGALRARPDRFSPYHADPARFGIKKPVPHPFYRSLYPPKRFKLEDIAYFFNFAEADSPAAAAYAEDFRRAVASWRRMQPSALFAYRRGGGFLRLYDSRPAGFEGPAQIRETTLEGPEEFLLLYCDEIRTRGQIVRAVGEAYPALAAGEIGRLLDRQVVEKRIMREDESYLTLAVPLAGLAATQRVYWESHQFLREMAAAEPQRPLRGG